MTHQQSKPYRKKISRFLAQSFIRIVILSCIVAVILVSFLVNLIFHQDLTPFALGMVCLSICCLTICMTGLALFYQTKRVTAPISKVSQAVMAISKGEFKTRIPDHHFNRKGYPYENELDELVDNVNKMASELEGMAYMRKDFMSNVSHEVKTPVAAITGFSEILLEGNLSQSDQNEYLELVYKESIRLSNLCDDMLKLSRLDHQEIVESKAPFRLDEQIRKCVIVLSEKWQDKAIEFDLSLADITVVSDKNLMWHVWMNLIDNAIKYSDQASTVKISIYRRSQDQSVVVDIQDEGIGMTKANQKRIFERFYQCEESHKSQGNGLGLSIVRRILELLEGHIEYESQIGQGTRVRVQLK